VKPAAVLSALLPALGLVVFILATGAGTTWFADADGNPIDGAAAGETRPQAGAGSQAGQRCLDEAELRRIIREELAASAAASLLAPPPATSGAVAQLPSAADAAHQLDRVNQQLDEYIRAGSISEPEMAALQGEIARLDPAGQREALGKIVRAMNSGALAGHL
jgi:hypothetical protein